jgi:hypothetical protein
MKRTLYAALLLLGSLTFLSPRAAALTVAKDIHGLIAATRLDMTITSQASCDQSGDLLRDGSRLVSDQFTTRVDDAGVGVFSAPVRVLNPDGNLLFEARLHGYVGLSADGDKADVCTAPGRLVGFLERAVGVGPVAPGADMQILFTAETVPQSASPVPIYQGTLRGVIAPQPVPGPGVVVRSDRNEYSTTDPIIGSVTNGTRAPIVTTDYHTGCTILELQRLVNGVWQPGPPCNTFRPTRPVVIQPGETVRVVIPAEPQRAPGEYRLALEYFAPDKDGNPAGDPKFAYSSVFVLRNSVNPLTIAPNQRAYGPREPITAVIRNGNRPVSILDERSFCTIVQLQKLDGDAWTEVAPCPLDRVAIPTFLKPGEVRRVLLPPNNVPAAWAPGRYRLAVTYTPIDNAGQADGPEIFVATPPFMVGTVLIPMDRTHTRAR